MKKILFLSYDGLLDPLGQSQILPYVEKLSSNYDFQIFSFEKKNINNKKLKALKDRLSSKNIKWFYLKFNYHGFLKKIIKLLYASFILRRLNNKNNFELIHLRGFFPGLIYYLSFIKKKYIYDFRSFAVDEYVEIGKLNSNSLIIKFFKYVDKKLIKELSGLVVLENSALEALNKSYNLNNINSEVIRTSTDISKYLINNKKINNYLKLVLLGGARNPYRIDWSLDLIKHLADFFLKIELTFINYSDHQYIRSYIDEFQGDDEKFSFKVIKIENVNIPKELNKFDAGLIFIEPTPSRFVCSPTKLGEFLSSGLPVISNKGINVLEYIQSKYKCVYNISVFQDKLILKKNEAKFISNFLKNKNIKSLCQSVAKKEFNLDLAVEKYDRLYKRILITN